MMKIFIILVIISVLLCGCRYVPEETGTIDYDAMDKKFGQMQEEETVSNDMALYEEDMEEIQSDVKWYAEMVVSKSAELCVEYFPRQFIEMIMSERGCKKEVAKGIAISKIEEVFHNIERDYREILAVWTEVPHEVTIERIKVFPQLTSLKDIYGSYGVTIEDAIDVDFIISAGRYKAPGQIRLVKMDYGMWEVDMSFFEI